MKPADGSAPRLTIGIGVVLAVLGICCITTLAVTGVGIAARQIIATLDRDDGG